jgi:CRP/FNR family transcriptional activator FtrB
MKSENLDRIRRLALFAGMSEDSFGRMTRGALMQKYPAETVLLYEADTLDFLYIVLDGSVELHAHWHHHETTLAVLRPISTFILAAVVLEAPALMSARTLERAEIVMIPAENLRTAMREDAAFAFAAAQELSGCYRGLVRTIKNHKLRSGTERLANYLLTQQVRQGDGARIVLPHEKRILASLLDMTPESLSRAFSALAKYAVTVQGANVTLGDTAALRRLARPDALIDNHMPPRPGNDGKAAKEAWPPSERTCSEYRQV